MPRDVLASLALIAVTDWPTGEGTIISSYLWSQEVELVSGEWWWVVTLHYLLPANYDGIDTL